MPTPYLIKISKEHNIPVSELETVWNKAKSVIHKEYKDLNDTDEQFYALVTSTFLKMIHLNKKKKSKTLKEDGEAMTPGPSSGPLNTNSTIFGLDQGLDTRPKGIALGTVSRNGSVKSRKPKKLVGYSKMIPSMKKMLESFTASDWSGSNYYGNDNNIIDDIKAFAKALGIAPKELYNDLIKDKVKLTKDNIKNWVAKFKK